MLRETICVATIESKRGSDNAAAIAGTPGIDGITIGPGDLALDLGLPPIGGHDIRPGPHADAIHAIVKACKAHNVACGMTSDSATAELKELGMQIISLGADAAFFEAGMKAALARR
jgi:4-hydroxy-2-oxoheptanedioate aldolase